MIIILTGVTGSGKTTIGKLLAHSLGWKFYEGDDYHLPANVEKMRKGVPLNDHDRMPWLLALGDLISALIKVGENAVIACSALKAEYRNILRVGDEVVFVYLDADVSLIQQRVTQRRGHFMNPALVHSQFEILDRPKEGLYLDAALPPAEIIHQIRTRLGV